MSFNYVYQYKDHLGNIRLSFTKDVVGQMQVIEQDNYYALGLKHKGYNNVVTSDGNTVAQKYTYKVLETLRESNTTMIPFSTCKVFRTL